MYKYIAKEFPDEVKPGEILDLKETVFKLLKEYKALQELNIATKEAEQAINPFHREEGESR